jgi:hypothetical protein
LRLWQRRPERKTYFCFPDCHPKAHHPKRSRGLHMTVREILEKFWREEDGEMEKIEHEAFWEDMQKILRGHE